MIYYCHRRRSWHPLFDEVFDEIAEIKYGEENVIFVRPQNDKKSYLITHFDIRRIIDIREQRNMNSNSSSLLQLLCLSADDFVYCENVPRSVLEQVGKDKVVHNGSFICAKDGVSYSYIFPAFHRKPKVIKEIDVVDYPRVRFFNYGNEEYVHIRKKGKVCIYTIEGTKIGEYDYFRMPYHNPYSIIGIEAKKNYYSFEKMKVWFDNWFDDCEPVEEINGNLLFRVVEKGTSKILDEHGNDVSSIYSDYF